ncbi:MAG TPA: PilC/PilY family type IV pilus protein, partial [Thermoanaerobaculia bacterium]
GNPAFNATQTFYVKASGLTYKATYAPVGAPNQLGNATIQTTVTIVKCTPTPTTTVNTACSTNSAVGTTTVTWNLVSDFIAWDLAPTPGALTQTDSALGYFNQGTGSDGSAGNTCSGWDPNTDSAADAETGACNPLNGPCPYSIRFPTDSSDARGALFTVGDVIPLDWQSDHNLLLQQHMAPNLINSPAAAPDFRIATYFKDQQLAGDTFLRLKSDAVHPFMANGSTPIGFSLLSFRQWYAGCQSGNCPSGGGWKGIAAANDPNFACSRKYVLFITDGDETCGSNPCTVAQDLHDRDGVTTYIMGFGLSSATGNTLNCVAANGGSGTPIFPQNKQQLINALNNLFATIQEEATAFASAAVPSVQADVSDKLVLTTFDPLNGESVWDGHANAFLKPLPLTPNGNPDTTRLCSGLGSNPSSCLLWDAGTVLTGQAPPTAPPPPNISAAALRLDVTDTTRRVFYGKANLTGAIPSTLRLFTPPQGGAVVANMVDPDWVDLWTGLGIPYDVANPNPARDRTEAIINNTLVPRSSVINRLDGTTINVTYVMGDVFHANPLVLDNPSRLSYLASDLKEPLATTTCGYRCFASTHEHRRKVLLLGANDGQLHAFDIGTWDNGPAQAFKNGTGEEIFSYIPRLVLPIVRDQQVPSAATPYVAGTSQIFSVDGSPTTADVFIDPHHATATAPDPTKREWRSVVVGGFREGGTINGGSQVSGFVSGYYALDLTQPDVLDASNNPSSLGGTQAVPSCLRIDNSLQSGCGVNPYPALLWEFTDSLPPPLQASRLDEDRNSAPDLGATWSSPTITRIQVKVGGTAVAKYVAIFGGGFDELNKSNPKSGTWLYMVDVETGQVIYKRALQGAAAADPTVVDTNRDGFADVIYISTTAGFLYKVDLSTVANLTTTTIFKNQTLPNLAADTTVTRVVDAAWNPFIIFSTGGRPLFFSPTALFVSTLNRTALAFGTGDRENLWNLSGLTGRYYLIVDDGFTSATSGLPKTESNYQAINPTAADVSTATDFVLNPTGSNSRGWFLQLDVDERTITQAFGISGVLIFSTYKPQVVVSGSGSTVVCARSGESRQFVLLANNANHVLSVGGTASRFAILPEFVTTPFIEQTATKNAPASNKNSAQLDADQTALVKTLKKLLFPPRMRFAPGISLSVSGVLANTKYVREATIPQGVLITGWKEW